MNDEKLSSLKASSKLSSKDDIETFENILEQVSMADADWLPKLFLVFNDDCGDEGVMFSLIHTIERFPDSYYVKSFVDHIDSIYENSKYWASMLFSRIINNENCLNEAKKILRTADRKIVLALLTHMEKNEQFDKRKHILEDLRKLLE
jgi:F0F1-type ATP synthase delta subunit